MRIFSVDLERSGQSVSKHFTTQIGVVCFESTLFDENDPGKCIISTFSEYLPQPENTCWEERCVREFWEMNPELYQRNKNGVAQAKSDVMERFVKWIDEHKDLDPTENLLITDNSAFDYVCLAPLLAPYRSLLYLFGYYEQTPLDVTSYYLGLQQRNIPDTHTWGARSSCGGAPKFSEMLNLTQHDAGSDATMIGLNYLWVTNNLNK
jgi:hypothetical protein